MKFNRNITRHYLFMLLINPMSYIMISGFIIYVVLQFFIGQQFFSDVGSTDFHYFFSGFSYAFILIVPAFCALVPYKKQEMSYPCSSFELIFSKIISVVSFISVGTILTATVGVSVSFFGDVDISLLLTGYIGIFFYIIASVSLCILLSTLLEKVSYSFFVSAIMLAVINTIHNIFLYFNLSGFFSYVAKKLSFAWHFDSFGKGLIDTRDIIFYVAMTCFFIVGTVLVLERRRGVNGRDLHRFSILSAVTLILVLIDSSIMYRRIDFSQGKKYTLSAYSRSIVNNVEEPLSIVYYRSKALSDLYPQVRDVDDFLEEYAGCSSYISYKLVDPSRKNSNPSLENLLASYGIDQRQIQTAGRDSTSYTSVYSAVVVTYLGETRVIPFLLDTSTLEYDLTSHVESLVKQNNRLIQILVGNGLTLDSDYSYIRPWLSNQGFSIIETNLPSFVEEEGKGISFDSVNGIPLLILGTAYFTQEDADALCRYILNGGKAMIAMTPYSIDIKNDWSVIEYPDNVSYMLQNFGIYLKDTLTADLSNFRLTMYSSGEAISSSTKAETVNYSLWPVLMPQTNALGGLSLFWPCAMDTDNEVASDNGYQVESYLVTSDSAWQSTKVQGSFITNPFFTSKKAEDGEETGRFDVSVSMRKKDESVPQLIVLGDQYALTSNMINYASEQSLDLRSLDFLTDSLLVLNNEKAILDVKNKNQFNSSLYKVSLYSLINAKYKVILLDCGIPVLIVLIALAFVKIKQKRFNTVAI